MGCNSSKQQLHNGQKNAKAHGLQENLVKNEKRKAEKAYDMEETAMAAGTSTLIRKGQSKVYEYTKTKRTNANVAIKLYDGKSALPVDLKEEASILSTCDHPNIVKLYEVTKTNQRTSLVLELCNGGTIQDYIERVGFDLRESRAKDIVRQIVSAVAYLHHNGIVHRDIELSNIMFVDAAVDRSDVKLIDFGSATRLEMPKPGMFKFLTEKTGSVHVMAPEVIHGRYGPKCDVWSVGVITYMLLMGGKRPFEGNSVQQYETMITKSRMTFGSAWKRSEHAKKFILECTTQNPASRLSAAEALQHIWLTEIETTGSVKSPNRKKTMGKYIPNELAVSIALFQRASPLKRIALNALAMKATSSKYRELFQRLDAGHTGYLTKEEFLDGFAKSGLSTDELEDAYHKLDVNCNDRIMYTEFLAMTMEVDGEVDEGQLREAFDLLDTDHSGCITKKNLMKILGESSARTIASALDGHEKVSFRDFLLLFQRDNSVRRGMDVITEAASMEAIAESETAPAKSSGNRNSALTSVLE